MSRTREGEAGANPSDAPTGPLSTDHARQGLFDRRYRWLTAGVLLSVGFVAFDGLGVTTALPRVSAELGGASTYGWAVSALMLASVIGTVVSGAVADRRGLLGPYVTSGAVFVAGLLLSGLADSWFWFLGGRLVQGLGVGGVLSMAYVIVAAVYPPVLRSRALALTSGAWMVPALIGPSISAALAESVGWRALFFVVLPLAGATSLLTALRLRRLLPDGAPSGGDEARGRISRTLVFGTLLAVGSGMLLAGVGQSSSALLLALVVPGAVIAMVSFGKVTPPGTLLARRGVPAGIGARTMICLAYFGGETFYPLAATQLRGLSLTESGFGLSAGALCWVLGSVLQAKAEASRGPHTRVAQTVFGIVLLAGGLVLVAVGLLSSGMPSFLAAVGWGVGGLGMGFAYNATTTETLDQSAPSEYGQTGGTVQMAQTLATALIAGAGTAAISAAHSLRSGLAVVFVVLVACSALTVPFAIRIKRGHDGAV